MTMQNKHMSHLSLLIILAASTPAVLSQSVAEEKTVAESKEVVQAGSLTATQPILASVS